MSKIKEIVEKYFWGNYSKKTQNAFISWLRSNKETDQIERALESVWEKVEAESDASTEISYQKIIARIDHLNESSSDHSKIVFRRRMRRVAVAVVVPLLFGALTFLSIKYINSINLLNSIEYVECFVPDGEMKTILLPDSSQVYLNSGSVLIYPTVFVGKKREVYLSGEASFEVRADKKKLFKVKTTGVDVEVLGTVFNVSAYINDENTRTTLSSGSVRVVLKNNGDKSIVLNPNEQLRYNRNSGEMELRQVDASSVLAWNKGHLIIQSLAITDIAKLIERKYGVDVFLNSNKYKDEKITAKFIRDENLGEFMCVIQQLIPGFKYKIDDDKIYIY